MSEYPKCMERVIGAGGAEAWCSGSLVPLSVMTHAGYQLTFGKWKCTKCGRVVE